MRIIGKCKSITIIIFILYSVLQVCENWCLRTHTAQTTTITMIQYNVDKSQYVTVSSTGRATLWNAYNSLIQTRFTPGTVTSARFNKNNTMVGVSINTGMIYLYNNSYPFSLITSFNSNIGNGNSYIDFSHDSTSLLVCGQGGGKLISLATLAATVSVTTTGTPTQCRIGSTGQFAIISNKIELFSSAGATTWQLSVNSCINLDFDGTSNILVAVCNNGANKNAQIVNPTTVSSSSTVYTSSALLRSAAVTPNSKWAAYGGDDKLIRFVNISNPSYPSLYNFSLDSQIYCSAFSYDSNYLLVATKLGYIYQFHQNCMDCQSGQYYNASTNSCALCSQFNRACGLCINSTYCLQCSQSYYIQPITALTISTHTKQCLPCSIMQACIACNSSTVCVMCQVSYYLTSAKICNKCSLAMNGCLRCNTSSTCQLCTNQYYISSNKCTLCNNSLTACLLCTSSSSCEMCQAGYYESGGTCHACGTNCLVCNSSTGCISCANGYYPTNINAATVCSKCPGTGCTICNQTGYCLQCSNGRYLDTGTCLLCTFPCSLCNSSTLCINCIMGYYLDYSPNANAYSGGVCRACTYPCLTCSSSSSLCLSCPVSYYLIQSNSTCNLCINTLPHCQQCTSQPSVLVCLNCTLGYYLNTSNVCTACNNNMWGCVSCTSISTCTECGTGYYLTANTGNNSCAICKNGCQICNSTAYCSHCINGYYLDTSNACIRCVAPCITCTSPTACTQCQTKYYLNTNNNNNTSTCTICSSAISNCLTCDDQLTIINSTITITCTSCILSYYINTTTNTCIACSYNCVTCTSTTYCTACNIGYYLNSVSHICLTCPYNCSTCTSATYCTSCILSYYLNTTANLCYHCTALGNGCTTCMYNTTYNYICTSCLPAYYLTANNTCNKCIDIIAHCQYCNNDTTCDDCMFGYLLINGTCTICSTINGCLSCTNNTACTVCQNGYYLTANSTCNVCATGCLTCTAATVCVTCQPAYIIQASTCTPCHQLIQGCQLCNSTTVCLQCQNGYYHEIVAAVQSCKLCRTAMKGCKYCNSSSVCTSCVQAYYMLGNNTCEMCNVGMQGCQLCVASNNCIQCANGYYINNVNVCAKCVAAMPGCYSCSSSTRCNACSEMYTLKYASPFKCLLCSSVVLNCLKCVTNTSSYSCVQCQSGYYLRSNDSTCQPCSVTGCQICYQSNPAQCVSCNSMFYYNSTSYLCEYCPNYISACVMCTSNTVCTMCQTMYYLNSSNGCSLCQLTIQGCAVCEYNTGNVLTCKYCKSAYYLNSSSNTCRACLSALPGCLFCNGPSVCVTCSNDYYYNTTTLLCQLCNTVIPGCLACNSSTYCMLCQANYYALVTVYTSICQSCSVLVGCYSCINSTVCQVCVGGYVLNSTFQCQLYKALADQPISTLKMYTEYVDNDTLSHSLLANLYQYVKQQYSIQQWNTYVTITILYPDFSKLNLTIKAVEWLGKNQLIFYTNNPLNIIVNKMPNRLLVSSIPNGYKTLLKMQQGILNTILPDYYMANNLNLDYQLDRAQFQTSITSKQLKLYYSAAGIAIVVIFIINYIVQALVTCPNIGLSQYGQILPHILALKSPALIVFPIYAQYIDFCYGFMAVQLPWARHIFASLLSDKSQAIPQQYAIFYDSMSLSSTYLLPLLIIVVIIVILWLYYKNHEKQEKQKIINSKSQDQIVEQKAHGINSTNENINAIQSRWGLPNWPIKMVLYNIFLFGLVFNASACLQNAILNPISQISIAATFTIIGILCYGFTFALCLSNLFQSQYFIFQLRVLIKSTLLSLSYISPTYISCATIILDLILMIIQYRITLQNKLYPKLWLYNNTIINLCLALMIFLHSHFVIVVIVCVFIATILLIQLFVHCQLYSIEKKKNRFMIKKQFKLEEKKSKKQSMNKDKDINIWNIDDEENDKGHQNSQEVGHRIRHFSKNKQQENLYKQFESTAKTKMTDSKKQKRKRKINKFRAEQSIENIHEVQDAQDKVQIFLAQNYLK